MGRPRGNYFERWWSYVDQNGPVPEHRPDLGSCWLWTGGVGAAGYGVYATFRKARLAHRWGYENFRPSQLQLARAMQGVS